jgi:hypothetical protein
MAELGVAPPAVSTAMVTLASTVTLATAATGSKGAVGPASVEPGSAVGSAVPGVPEPSTWALMMLGLGALGAKLRTRRPEAEDAGRG